MGLRSRAHVDCVSAFLELSLGDGCGLCEGLRFRGGNRERGDDGGGEDEEGSGGLHSCLKVLEAGWES